VYPIIALGVLVVWMLLSIGIGIASTSSDVDLLRSIAQTPRATLAAPRQGPAVYAGRIHAAASRQTPRGTPAAAYWWWVILNSTKRQGRAPLTACRAFASDHLVLEADGKRVNADLFADEHGIQLVANDRDEGPDRMTIDLGPTKLLETTDIPDSLARCKGERGVLAPGREYQERMIAEGAEVEVLACWNGTELVACDQKVGGILAVPTLSVDLAHRSRVIRTPLRVATLVSFVPLLALGITAGRLRKRRHAREGRPGSVKLIGVGQVDPKRAYTQS